MNQSERPSAVERALIFRAEVDRDSQEKHQEKLLKINYKKSVRQRKGVPADKTPI